MDKHPNQGGGGGCNTLSCLKLRPCGPPWLMCDLTFFFLLSSKVVKSKFVQTFLHSPYLFTSDSSGHLTRSRWQCDSEPSLWALHFSSSSVHQETHQEIPSNWRLVFWYVIIGHVRKTRRELRLGNHYFRSRDTLWHVEIGKARAVQVGCSGPSRGPLKKRSRVTWGAEDARVTVVAETGWAIFIINYLFHCHKTVIRFLSDWWFWRKSDKTV